MVKCDPGERASHIYQHCRKPSRGGEGHYDYIYTDDVSRVVYCSSPGIPTDAFNMFLRSIISQNVLTADTQEPEPPVSGSYFRPQNVKPLSSFSASEISMRLKTYLKILVVRHPFSRLMTLWENRTDDYVIQRQRERPAPASKEELQHFRKFVRSVADRTLRSSVWPPVSRACHSCHLEYDVIVRMETLGNDLPEVVSRLLSKHGTISDVLSDRQVSFLSRKTSEEVHKFYNGVAKNVVRKLVKIYHEDFRQYGYVWHFPRSRGGCKLSMKSGRTRKLCC